MLFNSSIKKFQNSKIYENETLLNLFLTKICNFFQKFANNPPFLVTSIFY